MSDELRKWIEEVQQRCDAATEASRPPWTKCDPETDRQRASIRDADGCPVVFGVWDLDDDLDFCIHARTALPQALSHLRDLLARAEAAEAESAAKSDAIAGYLQLRYYQARGIAGHLDLEWTDELDEEMQAAQCPGPGLSLFERYREALRERDRLRAFRDAAVKALNSIEFVGGYTVGPGSAVRNEAVVDHALVAAAVAIAKEDCA